jgi:hypothetical protein
MAHKKEMKSEWVRIRVTEHFRKKLYAYADRHNVSVTHVLTEYIRRLPNKPSEDSIDLNESAA